MCCTSHGRTVSYPLLLSFFFTYSGIQTFIYKFQVIVITHDVDLLDALSRGTQIEHYHKVSRDENGESIVNKTAVSTRWWRKSCQIDLDAFTFCKILNSRSSYLEMKTASPLSTKMPLRLMKKILSNRPECLYFLQNSEFIFVIIQNNC